MAIYVRFIADGSIVSDAIGLRTLGKPSHVEYVITHASGKPYSTFGARLIGGVKFRPYNYCKPTWEEWYTFDGIEASYKEALKFEGRKYSIREIIHLLFGWAIPFYDPKELICSVLFGYSNRRAWGNGTVNHPIMNPNIPTWEMTPMIDYACCTQMVNVYRDPVVITPTG